MSAEFFFSFLLFFQVQMDSIRQSGFYQLLEERYPLISKGIDEVESEEGLQEILKIIGLEFDDLESFSLTVEGLEGISKVHELGRAPKIGSELDFLLKIRFKGKINQHDLISFMLEELEKEKGKEQRDLVEKTQRTNGNISYLTIPVEVMGHKASSSDLLMAINKDGNHSELIVGILGKVEEALEGKLKQDALTCLNAMSQKRQVTLAMKVDPALWE